MAAAAATKSGNSGIFWKSSASDEEQPLVFIPGVGGAAKMPLNLGRGSTSIPNKSRTGTRKSKGMKDTALQKDDRRRDCSESECSGLYHQEEMSHALVESIPQDSGAFYPSTKVFPEPTGAKSIISLKDLCPDDKRRIANLIEELARVSEEKEASVQRLKDEHQNFEQKIQQLEEQNVMIAQERESLQHQYKECQELLGLYQQYLSLQQVKLNQSIAQLSQDPAVSKVLSREEAISSASSQRSNSSLLDGSYLGGARIRERCRGKESAPAGNKSASRSCAAEFSPENRQLRRQKCEAEFHHGCQGGCHGAQQLRCVEGPRRKSGPLHEFHQHRCESGHRASPAAQDTLTTPVLGHKDWEEKRHQLLLQKMQLEVERERLQVRLAEQEERLSRQSQQLQQSRLQPNRDQQADLSRSYSANGDPHVEASIQQQQSGSRNNPDEHAVPAGGGSSLLEKQSQTEAAVTDQEESLKCSRKDIGTSTINSSVNPKTTPALVLQELPHNRMEFSVWDIMSPISAPKPTTGQPKMSRQPVSKTPRPGDTALLSPTWSHHQQDREESQILEDIFFIC